jgi:pyruvate kinase
VDFISLSYTRSVDDVVEARAFLDAVGLQNTKVCGGGDFWCW